MKKSAAVRGWTSKLELWYLMCTTPVIDCTSVPVSVPSPAVHQSPTTTTLVHGWPLIVDGDGGGGEGGGGGGGGGAGGGGGRGGGGGPRRCASAEQHHVQSTAATVAQRAPLASRADAPCVVAPELLPEWAAPHACGAHGII